MLTPAHRAYLKQDMCINSAIINFVLNGIIGWWSYRALAAVPIIGDKSISADTVAMTLLLPLFSCLVIMPLVRIDLKRGRFPALAPRLRLPAWLDKALSITLLRSVLFGVLFAAVFGYPAALIWQALRSAPVPLWAFVAYKALFSAALAALGAPLMALWALSDFQAHKIAAERAAQAAATPAPTP